MISQRAIANRLGISRSAVAGHIMKLTSKGIIKGRSYVISDMPFVALIGGANMDIHGKAAGALHAHDSNPGAVSTSPGGVARNIAENLARLGVDCRLVSAVGDDHHGELLLRHCREAGVDTRHVERIESARTSTYLSVLDEGGELYVAINDMAIIEEIGPERLNSQAEMLKQASLIVLDTNLRGETLAWITDNCAGQTLFADTVSAVKAQKIEPYLGAIHTLKTSENEAEALTGLKCATRKDCRKVADWVHERGVARLFVTLGKRGVFYSTGNEAGVEKLQGQKHAIRNSAGAGDAFLAAIAYAWLEGWPLVKSVHFAMAAAAVTLADSATSSPAMSLAAVNRAYENQHAG